MRAEAFFVLALCLLVLALHDVGYLLRQPYWNDEAWVAVTTRFPITRLPAVTSSTPIGWSFLLRLVTFGRGESGRLLPLAFAAIAVIPGYCLARGLDWKDRGTAVLAAGLGAAAVLMVPAMLVRADLKQYTADTCMTLAILALTARLERRWSRGGLTLLSIAVWGGMLLSHAAAFAGAAAFGAICVIQLTRRDWRRLLQAAIATAGTAVLGAAVYETVDARAVVPGLLAYWRDYYVPVGQGLGASASFISGRFELIQRYFGLGPAWLAAILVLAGLVTMARLGRPATAVAAAALWPEMIILAGLRSYPFLDPRTSTFLITVTTLTAAIGVGGICALVRAMLSGRKLAIVVPVVIAAVALTAFGVGAARYVRGQPIPPDDIRQQAQYVARHAAPGDAVVVSSNSNWGFAYYWPAGTPATRPDAGNLQLYQAVFPDQPGIVVARGRDVTAIRAAMALALGRVRPGTCSRIWLVRTRIKAAEAVAWHTVLAGLGRPIRAARYGLAYLQAGPRSCRQPAASRH